LRSGNEALAILTGEPLLTKSNLEKNDTVLNNAIRRHQAPEEVDRISAAAKAMGLELPAKTKTLLLEDRLQQSPMERFLRGT
jgi:hypothetical protein